MTVNIAPNIKRERVQIDMDGNEVVPFTHQIVKPVETPYVPTPEEVASATAKKGGEEKLSKEEITQQSQSLDIESMISKKIESIIEKKISDVLEKMLK